jgi:hypothetical protein
MAAALQRQHTHRDRKRDERKKEHRGRAPQAEPPVDADAYSVPEFCRRHGGMSVAFFYKLASQGLGPVVMKVGARTFVSTEAAAAWRREREAETMAKRAVVTTATTINS